MRRGVLAFLPALVWLDCSSREAPNSEELAREASAVQAADRKILGLARPYAADATLRDREDALLRSQKLRRAMAWRTIEQILTPVALAETPAAADAGVPAAVPAFQTWYDREDVKRIFHRLYDGIGAERRRARDVFSGAEQDSAFIWNTRAVEELPNWPEDRFRKYLDSKDEATEVAGIGGIARVAYSPATLRHLFTSYPRLTKCLSEGWPPPPVPAPSSPLSPAPSGVAAPAHAGSPAAEWARCLVSGSAFPLDAAVVKAAWVRADFGRTVPTYDTSAEALKRRHAPDGGVSWEQPDGESNPGPEAIYTLKLANENTYRLAGLHVITKELDHWVWITLWWAGSASPDEDFGADRPSGIARLGGPWRNYKMCTVTGFEERDPDATGGFAEHPSLARALAAVHNGEGGPSWCSNPYIERGQGNAQTNCIGCHQHAGSRVVPADILSDGTRFPARGRTLIRSDFPTDYSWSVNQGDRLGQLFADEISFYESAARKAAARKSAVQDAK